MSGRRFCLLGVDSVQRYAHTTKNTQARALASHLVATTVADCAATGACFHPWLPTHSTRRAVTPAVNTAAQTPCSRYSSAPLSSATMRRVVGSPYLQVSNGSNELIGGRRPASTASPGGGGLQAVLGGSGSGAPLLGGGGRATAASASAAVQEAHQRLERLLGPQVRLFGPARGRRLS